MAMTYIAPRNGSKIGYYYDVERTGIFNGYPYKGIVTAVMKGTRSDAWNKIRALGDKVGVIFMHGVPAMEESYHGVAYCAADDEFNLTEGMRVARQRLLRSYHKDMAAAMAHCYPAANEFAAMLFDAELEHDVAAAKNDNRSENYGKNTSTVMPFDTEMDYDVINRR